MASNLDATPSREHLFHALSEAAELEHCLMCTYLYAAFTLKTGADEGLTPTQLDTVRRWRATIIDIAAQEMGHLVAVWNITAALGGAPRLGRSNFPLDPGYLPAGIVVRLAPFDVATLQHFIHLESPTGSNEPDSPVFAPERIDHSCPLMYLVAHSPPAACDLAYPVEDAGALPHRTSFLLVTVLLASGFLFRSRGAYGTSTSGTATTKAPRKPSARCDTLSRHLREGKNTNLKERHQMIRSRFNARLGTSAALAAMLLTAFASQSHAAVSMQDDDLQIAPSMVASMTEAAAGELDANCAPPSDLVACTSWHQVIRANFSAREIGILFGTATSYPEFATSYARIKSRYARLQNEFSANRMSMRAVSVK